MKTLEDLCACPDVDTLKPAVHAVCSRYGTVQRLDILTSSHEGTQQAICFLRMKNAEEERALMRALGVGRFGGEIVFVIDLHASAVQEVHGPSSQWADSDLL